MIGKFTEYTNFGRVYEMEDAGIILRVTVDIGPRVIYYGTKDLNFMFEDVKREINKGGEYFDKNFGKGRRWDILGGHRLWKSPEDLASYSVDDTPVKVEFKDNSIVFAREAESTTGLIKEIEIESLGSGRFKVEHRFTNTSKSKKTYALWALTVLRGGGKVVVPLNDNDKELLPTRNLVFWAYSGFKDKRLNVEKDFLTVEQRFEMGNPFKIGLYSNKGVAGYLYSGMLFSKTFDVVKDGNYADYSCNFECYTNDKFIECESLSELTDIAPGTAVCHTEVWQIEKVGAIAPEEACKMLLKK